MTIERINANLTLNEKIKLLNNMLMELNGKVSKAQFDKIELDAAYARGNVTDRKFIRNASLGHTLSAYTGWSHIKTETGYSIWKFTPTNYKYNELNEFYLDDEVLENKFEATAESATVFDNGRNLPKASVNFLA